MTLLTVPSFLPLPKSLLPVLLFHTQRPSVDPIKNYSNDGLVLSLNGWVLGTLWPPQLSQPANPDKGKQDSATKQRCGFQPCWGFRRVTSKSKDLHVCEHEERACLVGHLAGQFHGCFSLQLSQGMPQPKLKKTDTCHFEILRQIKKALSCEPRHFSDLNC